jgi:uncharacterized membrane protein YbaN (DUF454 family)
MRRDLFRVLLVFMGACSLFLGILGIILPLLPTTPFLLLSAFCFSKGSTTLHKKLLAFPLLGESICHWERHRAITRKTKWLASFLLLGSLVYPIFFLSFLWIFKGLALLSAFGVLIFLWTRPELQDSLAQEGASGAPFLNSLSDKLP